MENSASDSDKFSIVKCLDVKAEEESPGNTMLMKRQRDSEYSNLQKPDSKSESEF